MVIVSAPRYGVEECAGDMAAAPAERAELVALSVGEFGQRVVAARRGHLRVVELVAAHHRARWPERAIRKQSRLAVAEIHLALGKTCGMAEQAEHFVRLAVGILKRLAQHHEAAALAMDGLCLREFFQAGAKT